MRKKKECIKKIGLKDDKNNKIKKVGYKNLLDIIDYGV